MRNGESSQPITSTEAKLEEALTRLINGEPIRSDGKLTKANLAREASVSRATAYRYTKIMKRWDELTGLGTDRKCQESECSEKIADLRGKLRQAKEDNVQLRKDIVAAATVIAELSARLEPAEHAEVVPFTPSNPPRR